MHSWARVRRIDPYLIVSSLIAVVALACGPTSVTEIIGPDAVRCELSLGSATASVSSAASQLSLAVMAQPECAWSARSDTSWVQVTPTAGQGEGTVTLSVATNTQQSARSSVVTINETQYRITQAAAPTAPQSPQTPQPPESPQPPATACTVSLDPATRSIKKNGGSQKVKVKTTSQCSWSATTTASWITFESASSGTGTRNIDYRVAPNTSGVTRIGSIVVANQVHQVTQDGK